MKRVAIALLFSLCAIGVIFVASMMFPLWKFAADSLLVGEINCRAPIAHFASNGFYFPALDSFFANLCEATLESNSSDTNSGLTVLGTFNSRSFIIFYGIIFAIFAAGLFILLQELHSSTSRALCGAASLIVLLVFVFGFDSAVLLPVAWAPLLLLALKRTVDNASLFSILSIALLSSLLATGNAPFAFLLAILGSWLFYTQQGAIAAIVPPLFGLLFFIAPEIPQYPIEAVLVPRLAGFVDTLPSIGPSPGVRFINRPFLRELFPLFASLSLLTGLWLKKRSAYPKLVSALLILSLCILCDSAPLPPVITEISPIQGLKNIVPGLAYLPLEHFIAATTAMLLLLITTPLLRPWNVALLSLIALFSVQPSSTALPRSVPPFAQAHLAQGHYSSDGAWKKQLGSPSQFVAATSQLNFQLGIPLTQQLTLTSPQSLGAVISASHNPALAPLAMDDNPSSRWNPHAGFQEGGEWIHVVFPNPTALRGVHCNQDAFPTDFPRGFRVEGTSSCDPHAPLSLLFDSPTWHGPLKQTELGYLYFGELKDVFALFPPQPLCQLRITQTASTSHLDWSIGEISLVQ